MESALIFDWLYAGAPNLIKSQKSILFIMGTEYFLWAIYLLLSLWLFPRIPFVKNAGLNQREIRILLGLKMLLGLTVAFYFERMSAGPDYLGNNLQGKIQYDLLLSNPRQFFKDFTNDVDIYGVGKLFSSGDSFWGYLRFIVLYKMIGLLNLVTRGSFYFNSLIFSSVVFFSHIAFFRIYNAICPGRKNLLLLACFFLPSLLLYTACIHKDGVVFISLGIVCYAFFKILAGAWKTRHIVFIAFGMMLLFLIRNYIMVALLPAMLVALLYAFVPVRKRLVIFSAYAVLFGLFFLSVFSRSFNLPAAVIQRKADFIALGKATTNIPMNDLQANAGSFLINLPQTVNHTLFRPYLWEFSQPGIILTALELLFYQLIVLVFIFYRKKPLSRIHAFNLFGIAFFVHMMLIIGYTIPNIGAIIRYRSIFWLFVLCPLLCNINWALFPFLRKFSGQGPGN